MTRDPQRPRPRPLDDAAIEQLVRDVADGWTMPPVRLDAPSWRDRVREPARSPARRGARLARRVGQAATAAVALTVVGALVAVVLTGRRRTPARAPRRPTASTPRADRRPRRRPACRSSSSTATCRTRPGPRPDGAGRLRARRPRRRARSAGPLDRRALRQRAPRSGPTARSSACACPSRHGSTAARPTPTVTLDRFDADGALDVLRRRSRRSSASPIRATRHGRPGAAAARPTAMGFSDGGRYGFVGWSVRAHPVWKSGIIVVDLADGSVVSRLDLPGRATGEGTRRTGRRRAAGRRRAGAGEVLVGRDRRDAGPRPDLATPSVSVRERRLPGELRAAVAWRIRASVPTRRLRRRRSLRGGALRRTAAIWLACARGRAERLILRRVAGDGRLLADVTALAGGVGIDGDATALSADGRALFAWDPVGARSRGSTSRPARRRPAATVAAATRDRGPLAALGHWLAPVGGGEVVPAVGVVVSPDGTRVYAIGVTGGDDRAEMSGSSGVFVFDAATLEPSIMGADGGLRVARGQRRRPVRLCRRARRASTRPAGAWSTRPASITVFATADGARPADRRPARRRRCSCSRSRSFADEPAATLRRCDRA